jgi:small subunit ribosomal protein S9
MNNLIVTGKRKSAIAKATIKEGKGIVTFNKRPISFLPNLQQLEISEPLIIAKNILGGLNFDISLNVKGGGSSSQVEASRLAIARAIVEYSKNEEVRRAFLSYDRNLLVADTRRKETCKPGDSKARARRQTSYR